MRNQFFFNPNDCNIKEVGELFCLQDAVITVDSSDVKEIMEDAENTIILFGKASGNNRLADAIEDAVLHTCSVAKDYNLFSANKVLLYIFSPKINPMLMSENESVNTFVQMFRPDVKCIWGLAEENDIRDMRIVIIASNLQKK